jgi:hypothetical protein
MFPFIMLNFLRPISDAEWQKYRCLGSIVVSIMRIARLRT